MKTGSGLYTVVAVLGWGAAVAGSAACNPAPAHTSGGSGGTGSTQSSAGQGGAGQGGADATSGTGGMDVGTFAGPGPGPATGAGGGICCGSEFTGEPSPLDIYLLLDKSESMATSNKWGASSNAIGTFVQSAEAESIGLGLTFFPISGPGGTLDSCQATDYAKAAVEMAGLPANSQPIINAMSAITPGGGKPTRPALDGALSHARDWAIAHPDHTVAMVLATDGEPNAGECAPNTTADAQAVAQMYLNATPPIKTYVIGIGSNLTMLDAIAQAGGTTAAHLVDSGSNTTPEFITALSTIRQDLHFACAYQIPPPLPLQMVDFTFFNVYFRGGFIPELIYHVQDAAGCDPVAGGWYYNDNAGPVKILLCPASCTKLKNTPSVEIMIYAGCPTEEAP